MVERNKEKSEKEKEKSSMNEISAINAEYITEIERTPEVIASEIRYIEESTSKVVLSAAVEIGKRLTEAKEKVNHGEWEKWCQENLNYSKSWAEKLMKISAEYGDQKSPYYIAISKTDTCPLLTISKAIRLLRVPENEIENFVENENVNEITVKELEEKIKELQAKSEEDAAELAEAAEENEKAEEHIQKLELELKQQIASMNEKIEEARRQAEENAAAKYETAIQQQAEAEARKEYEGKINELKKQIEAEKEKAAEAEKAKAAEAEAIAKVKEIEMQLEAAEKDKQSAIEEAVKKASIANDADFIKFKLSVDAIQTEFQKALNIAVSKDEETADKWKNALKGVLEATINRL